MHVSLFVCQYEKKNSNSKTRKKYSAIRLLDVDRSELHAIRHQWRQRASRHLYVPKRYSTRSLWEYDGSGELADEIWRMFCLCARGGWLRAERTAAAVRFRTWYFAVAKEWVGSEGSHEWRVTRWTRRACTCRRVGWCCKRTPRTLTPGRISTDWCRICGRVSAAPSARTCWSSHTRRPRPTVSITCAAAVAAAARSWSRHAAGAKITTSTWRTCSCGYCCSATRSYASI